MTLQWLTLPSHALPMSSFGLPQWAAILLCALPVVLGQRDFEANRKRIEAVRVALVTTP